MQKNVQKKASGSKFGALGCVLDGLGRARGVPRASQERPKTVPRFPEGWFPRALWRSWALLGTFLLFFAILFEFCMIFHRFLFEFWSILRRFLTESASNQSSQSKPKQAKASRSKPKEAKASKSQLELKFKISSTLDPACFCQAQSSVELILNLNSSWLLLALASFGLLLLAFAWGCLPLLAWKILQRLVLLRVAGGGYTSLAKPPQTPPP